MRKNIFIGIVFLLLVIGSLYTLNYIVDRGLCKSKSSAFYKYFGVWNDIYKSKINADIVFSGNSRAFVHISPKICDSILKCNTYNLGMNGWDFSMEFVRLKIYLQHNIKPKVIVQNVDFEFLTCRNDLVDYIQFVPFIYDTMIYNASKKYIGAFTLADKYFPLFKYNNQTEAIKEGIRSFFNIKPSEVSNIYKGYKGYDRKWDNKFDSFILKYPNGIFRRISDTAKTNFEFFLEYCKNNNIKVVLNFAPLLNEEIKYEINREQYFELFRYWSKKYEIPFLDYTNDSLCFDRKYFYNSQHLNKMGAEIYSTKLANDLKPFLN